MEKSTNIIEAILFASGNPVPTDLLKEKLELTKAEFDSCVHALEKKYNGECGIRLLNFNHQLQFATNPDYKESVSAVLSPIREKEFTRTILECVAIVAYKQPITRSELEAIRGINSDYAISTLMNLDMIYPSGRKDSIGKPVLYSTTDNFLKRFKLKSLKDLPDYEEFMKKISQLSAISDVGDDLYSRVDEVPTEDSTAESEEGGEEHNDGFEIPDFLQDVKDGIVKIQ